MLPSTRELCGNFSVAREAREQNVGICVGWWVGFLMNDDDDDDRMPAILLEGIS